METAKANIKAGLPKAKPDEQYAHLIAARFYWNYYIDRKQALAWADQSIKIKSIHAKLWAKAEWLAEEKKKSAEARKAAGPARAKIVFFSFMNTFFRTALGRLRVIAFLEGVSFLLLLGVAMPLKYLAGQPEWVRVVGMAHGLLFLAYIPLVFYVMDKENWSPMKTFQALLASIIPFGTFWADMRLFREPAS